MINVEEEVKSKNVMSINYYFENSDLDLDIQEPQEVYVDGDMNVIVDNMGYIFFIRPGWAYMSVQRKQL